MARRAAHAFSGVLCESPSLWVAEGRYLQDLRAHGAALPERIFLGVGTREYSGTRDHERCDVDELLLNYAREAAHILGHEKGVNVRFVVDEGAGALFLCNCRAGLFVRADCGSVPAVPSARRR